MYNTKKIVITINGVPVQMKGEEPEIEKSGDYSEEKGGVDGDFHNLAKNDVYDILHLSLKYDSPNVPLLESLAKNHVEFAASYKDDNTGEKLDTIKGAVKAVGAKKADENRKFDIVFLP